MDDDEKKELKKEDDDTSFHDDKLHKLQTSSSKSYLLAFKNVLKSLGPVYTAVINGIVAVPVFMVVMKIANDNKILKEKVNGKISNIIGCITIIIMTISVVMLFLTWHH